MSENLTALASENVNPSLRSLLEDVQRGHIRVPRFQRPFVWKDEQRLELLQSIRDNMPIGSLLIWRTVHYKLASFPSVGPHMIPSISDISPATGWQYLLDGHQRVSTLLGVLLKPTDDAPSDPERNIDWNIQYDLMDQDFVFAHKVMKKFVQRPLLPLWTLFDGRLVNKHMRELRKIGASNGWSDTDLEAWEERADQLSYRFQQCRIPIVVMVTDDLSLAAKTFQRINSLGTPMDEAHLVSALTWSTEFDLSETLDNMRKDFPYGWQKIEDGIFLQVCKGLSGLDMTKAAQNELVKKITDNEDLLNNAFVSLRKAVELLEKKAGVAQQELLPYTLQLVLLAIELSKTTLTPDLENWYVRWFWMTGWSEVFASASYKQVKQEQDSLSNKNQQVWTRNSTLPERFDFRYARVRLFMLRLAKRHLYYNDSGQTVDGTLLLKQFGREALVKLFSNPTMASPNLKKLLQGVGNRFLLNPRQETEFKDKLMSSQDLKTELLKIHFIDQFAIDALRSGDLEGFISHRAKLMEDWDNSEWENMKSTS